MLSDLRPLWNSPIRSVGINTSGKTLPFISVSFLFRTNVNWNVTALSDIYVNLRMGPSVHLQTVWVSADRKYRGCSPSHFTAANPWPLPRHASVVRRRDISHNAQSIWTQHGQNVSLESYSQTFRTEDRSKPVACNTDRQISLAYGV
jgi:hypothetical protein